MGDADARQDLAELDATDVHELLCFWLGVDAVPLAVLLEHGITGATLAQNQLTEVIMEQDLALACLGQRRRLTLGIQRWCAGGAADGLALDEDRSRMWTVRQTSEWLETLGLGRGECVPFQSHVIDGLVLRTLTLDDLAAMHVDRKHRKMILDAVATLAPPAEPAAAAALTGVAAAASPAAAAAAIQHATPAASAPEPIPQSWYCPLTHELMREPVMLADSESGHSYERAAIEDWLARGHLTDPITNMQLPSGRLIPNRNLKESILARTDAAGPMDPSGSPPSPGPEPPRKQRRRRILDFTDAAAPMDPSGSPPSPDPEPPRNQRKQRRLYMPKMNPSGSPASPDPEPPRKIRQWVPRTEDVRPVGMLFAAPALPAARASPLQLRIRLGAPFTPTETAPPQ